MKKMTMPKTMHSTLLMALAGVFLLGVSAASAHEVVKHPSSTSTATPVMSSHDGMTALYARLQEVENQLAANQLGHIHDAVEGITDATRDLDRDTTLDAAKKKRVQGYVKNVAKLMDKMHDAADGKKPDDAKKAFAQLKTQVDLLDKQFAHSHKPVAGLKPSGSGSTENPGRDSLHSTNPTK